MKAAFLFLDLLCNLLVDNLGDRAFRRREAIQAKLVGLGERAVPALQRGVESSDPEISRRCQLLLDRQWTPLIECRRWLKRNDIPWICLDGSYHSEASKYFLQRAYECFIPDGLYSQWRDATRIWLDRRLAEKAPPLWILQMIDQMRQAECDFCYGVQ